METVVALAAVEVVKTLIGLVITQAQKAGLSEEEIVKMFSEEKAKLQANDPANIPDV